MWVLVVEGQRCGRRPPVPSLARVAVLGEGLAVMTGARGAANATAKTELGWSLRCPGWRHGFPAAYIPIRSPQRPDPAPASWYLRPRPAAADSGGVVP
jgi:hypothetical protein